MARRICHKHGKPLEQSAIPLPFTLNNTSSGFIAAAAAAATFAWLTGAANELFSIWPGSRGVWLRGLVKAFASFSSCKALPLLPDCKLDWIAAPAAESSNICEFAGATNETKLIKAKIKYLMVLNAPYVNVIFHTIQQIEAPNQQDVATSDHKVGVFQAEHQVWRVDP